MSQTKKNFSQKSKRMTDDADLNMADKKSRGGDRSVDQNRSGAVRQPASSKDKADVSSSRREASRK